MYHFILILVTLGILAMALHIPYDNSKDCIHSNSQDLQYASLLNRDIVSQNKNGNEEAQLKSESIGEMCHRPPLQTVDMLKTLNHFENTSPQENHIKSSGSPVENLNLGLSLRFPENASANYAHHSCRKSPFISGNSDDTREFLPKLSTETIQDMETGSSRTIINENARHFEKLKNCKIYSIPHKIHTATTFKTMRHSEAKISGDKKPSWSVLTHSDPNTHKAQSSYNKRKNELETFISNWDGCYISSTTNINTPHNSPSGQGKNIYTRNFISHCEIKRPNIQLPIQYLPDFEKYSSFSSIEPSFPSTSDKPSNDKANEFQKKKNSVLKQPTHALDGNVSLMSDHAYQDPMNHTLKPPSEKQSVNGIDEKINQQPFGTVLSVSRTPYLFGPDNRDYELLFENTYPPGLTTKYSRDTSKALCYLQATAQQKLDGFPVLRDTIDMWMVGLQKTLYLRLVTNPPIPEQPIWGIQKMIDVALAKTHGEIIPGLMGAILLHKFDSKQSTNDETLLLSCWSFLKSHLDCWHHMEQELIINLVSSYSPKFSRSSNMEHPIVLFQRLLNQDIEIRVGPKCIWTLIKLWKQSEGSTFPELKTMSILKSFEARLHGLHSKMKLHGVTARTNAKISLSLLGEISIPKSS